MYADRKLDIAGPTTTIATMPRPPPVACVPVSSGDKPTATLHEIKMGQWNEDQVCIQHTCIRIYSHKKDTYFPLII